MWHSGAILMSQSERRLSTPESHHSFGTVSHVTFIRPLIGCFFSYGCIRRLGYIRELSSPQSIESWDALPFLVIKDGPVTLWPIQYRRRRARGHACTCTDDPSRSHPCRAEGCPLAYSIILLIVLLYVLYICFQIVWDRARLDPLTAKC